jgi:hypothetical protein
MILADKYELGQLIGGSTITVQKARAVDTGKSVLVHRLGGASAASVQALELALRYSIAHSGNRALLDVVDDGGCTYIVTADQPDYISLVDWLLWALSEPATLRGERSASGIFGDGGSAKRGATSSSPYTAGVQRPAVTAGLPLSSKAVASSTISPGEFTRIFQPLPNSTPAPAGDSGEIAGQFTPAAGSQISWPGESRFSGTGEFTRLFGSEKETSSPNSSSPEPVAEPMPLKPEPLYGGKAEPGEYTRLFRSKWHAEPVLPSYGEGVDRAREPGDTGQIASPQGSEMLGDPLSGTFTPQFSGGPSEYTRVIQAHDMGRDSLRSERAPQADPVPVKAEVREQVSQPERPNEVPQIRQAPIVTTAAEPRQRLLQALVILGAVLVAALILILLFVMRR